MIGRDRRMAKKGRLSEAAQLMAKAGASKAGLASARKLTPKQRSERARKASRARWDKKSQNAT